MVPPVAVRRFTTGDQDAVRRLILDGLAEHWGCDPDPTLNRDLDDIAESYASGTTLVAATSDGTVIGTGTLVPRSADTAEIVRMSVSMATHGQGIGRLIVDALMDVARASGVERVVLETTSTWHDTIRFYERCGFVITHQADSDFGQDTWFEQRVSGHR